MSMDFFEYANVTVQNNCAIYTGVRLLNDMQWDHGPEIEAVLNLETWQLDLQEWIEDAQVCNKKSVTLHLVGPNYSSKHE
jgi:hypothetical protein